MTHAGAPAEVLITRGTSPVSKREEKQAPEKKGEARTPNRRWKPFELPLELVFEKDKAYHEKDERSSGYELVAPSSRELSFETTELLRRIFHGGRSCRLTDGR